MLSELKSTLSTIENTIDRVRVYRRLAAQTDFPEMPAARRGFGMARR